jgi:hypothetical protein
MRRASLFAPVLAVVPIGLLAAAVVGPTAAKDAGPLADGQRAVGSWKVLASSAQGPAELSLATIGADGTLVTSPPPAFPAPDGSEAVIFTSAGHGAWAATGPDAGIVTFVVLMADGRGNLAGTVTVRCRSTLGADGQTFGGECTRTFADPAGRAMGTEQVTIQATRIVAEAPETTGTPNA